jgi:hypothetical protein
VPPGLLRIGGQAALYGAVRRGRDAGLFQHPRAVKLADRLDDPRQHQLGEHLIRARSALDAQHPVGAPAHPAGRPSAPRGSAAARRLAQPGRIGGLQAQVKLALAGRQPLPRGGLLQLQLAVIMRRPEVLDVPRPAVRRIYDLHRPRA